MTNRQLKDFHNIPHREFPLSSDISIVNSNDGDCFVYLGKCRYNLKEFYEVHTNDVYNDLELLAMIDKARLIKGILPLNWTSGYTGCRPFNIGFCYIKDDSGTWNKFSRTGKEVETNVPVSKILDYLRNNELKIEE